MIQAWITLPGLICDIVGFFVLAREWRESWFQADYHWHADEVSKAAKTASRPNALVGTTVTIGHEILAQPRESLEYLVNLLRKREKVIVKRRRQYFMVGFLLVILGFVLQFIGAWPVGNTS